MTTLLFFHLYRKSHLPTRERPRFRVELDVGQSEFWWLQKITAPSIVSEFAVINPHRASRSLVVQSHDLRYSTGKARAVRQQVGVEYELRVWDAHESAAHETCGG